MVKVQKTIKPVVSQKEGRTLPDVPKKIGIIHLKKINQDYQIIDSTGKIVGFLSVPKQSGAYYMPNWTVWQGDSLIDCCATLEQAIGIIQKIFKDSKKK